MKGFQAAEFLGRLFGSTPEPTPVFTVDLTSDSAKEACQDQNDFEPIGLPEADQCWTDLEAVPEAGEPCPTCNTLAVWWDSAGGRHCQTCEAAGLQRAEALATRAARLRERSPPVPSGGNGPEGKPEAADWPAALADFALLLVSDDLIAPFMLRPGVVVTDPALFLGRLKADILRGPVGPRARWGALQGDLRRLAETLTGEGIDRR